MEYGLRAAHGGDGGTLCAGLNPCFNGISSAIHQERRQGISRDVLILVLMEYGLRVSSPRWCLTEPPRLNPCFDGIWSASTKSHSIVGSALACLNPCLNGISSASFSRVKVGNIAQSGLNPCFNRIWSASAGEPILWHDQKQS